MKKDTLYLGLTRPATLGGIPHNVFVVLILATAWLLLMTKSLYSIVIGVMLYLFMLSISQNDIFALVIFAKSMRWLKRNHPFIRVYWGLRSYQP